MESIVQERIQKEKTKQNKVWLRRKWEEGLKNENFRVPEREELPQEEKNDEKTRGPGTLSI